MKKIYSIGYGSRNIDDFIAILKSHNITTLVDIRSMPASRFKPDYNKHRLSEKLLSEGIEYIFSGDSLGGKPKQEGLYTNGVLDYDKVAVSAQYKEGIEALISLANENTICIMCAELRPEECHRKNLVGDTLLSLGIDLFHLDESDGVVCQSEYNKTLF
ncbi:MAG TPA: DUF488 domain-containing protein [Flavipsychrobacter sp.]